MNKCISYARQDISEADIEEVISVLRSEFLTQGPSVAAFERGVAAVVKSEHAIAVSSATSALHIACLALGVGTGDSVWTVPNTFVASANCALYCGASVQFVDIDPDTLNMSTSDLEERLIVARKRNRLPKVVIPVHFAGQPCDMPEIYKLSKAYGFSIIEDASHALGAYYAPNGRPITENQSEAIKIGSCVHSDITVFSFHPVKIITTGEGGCLTTNDSALANKLKLLRSHGITSDPTLFKSRPFDEIWNYQQIDIGFNYRMTDIGAALGLSQLKRLDDFLFARNEIARFYNSAFSSSRLRTQLIRFCNYSSYHLYVVRISKDTVGKTQREVYYHLYQNGVRVNVHYIPVHRQPFYEGLGFKEGDFPEAEKYHREALTLPLYPSMNSEDCAYVAELLNKVLET